MFFVQRLLFFNSLLYLIVSSLLAAMKLSNCKNIFGKNDRE
jgi:hypothetical protein